jgi:hypothetical protein
VQPSQGSPSSAGYEPSIKATRCHKRQSAEGSKVKQTERAKVQQKRPSRGFRQSDQQQSSPLLKVFSQNFSLQSHAEKPPETTLDSTTAEPSLKKVVLNK